MSPCLKNFTFSLLTLFTALPAFASVPLDYKDIARADMKEMGFKYAPRRFGTTSSLDLRFPKTLLSGEFSLVPHSTEVVVRSTTGEEITRTTNWIGDNDFMAIMTTYNHKISDVSVVITYTCAKRIETGCRGAILLRIPSVSKFIDLNPDILNLQPKCRKVTSMIEDCTEYDNPEHP